MVKFSRCNSLLSLALNEHGEGCRHIVKGDTDQDVIDGMIKHITDVHEVDANLMVGNIKSTIKSTRQ